MLRVAHAVLVGLIGAGIIHLAAALALPAFSARATWKRLEEKLPPYRVEPLDAASSLPLQGNAPLFLSAVCRFDLHDGPLRVISVSSSSRIPWFASVYDSRGNSLAGVNDAMPPMGRLDVLIVRQAPAGEAGDGAGYRPGGPFHVEIDADQGLVAVRLLAPDRSWDGLAREALAGLRCEPKRG